MTNFELGMVSFFYENLRLQNSPVLGPTGLLEQDLIYEINDCPVKYTEDWYDCILNTVNQPALGYCVKQSFIQVTFFLYNFLTLVNMPLFLNKQ